MTSWLPSVAKSTTCLLLFVRFSLTTVQYTLNNDNVVRKITISRTDTSDGSHPTHVGIVLAASDARIVSVSWAHTRRPAWASPRILAMTAPHGVDILWSSKVLEVQHLPRMDKSDLLHMRYKRHRQTVERFPRTCNSPLHLTHPPRPSVAPLRADAAQLWSKGGNPSHRDHHIWYTPKKLRGWCTCPCRMSRTRWRWHWSHTVLEGKHRWLNCASGA